MRYGSTFSSQTQPRVSQRSLVTSFLIDSPLCAPPFINPPSKTSRGHGSCDGHLGRSAPQVPSLGGGLHAFMTFPWMVQPSRVASMTAPASSDQFPHALYPLFFFFFFFLHVDRHAKCAPLSLYSHENRDKQCSVEFLSSWRFLPDSCTVQTFTATANERAAKI
ncbi:hypothetical protein IF1G_03591 [Cordyceps javanica]|uniref:Uncharacterized protein n=1 Tax=Cordyceps javanica TaxID=43265 RepID=A0A545V816_9HYPO|nr:hypothetical protein IF1G_03591 [Cordyceps javanica]